MNANPRLFAFSGGATGQWKVIGEQTIKGDPLPAVTHLSIQPAVFSGSGDDASWSLRGVTSNTRYITQGERSEIGPLEPPIGRADSTLAAMIPLRKSDEWWSMTQQERREIFQRSSHHENGKKALPAIARRLHHCRDLATVEPFDFITWFEFAPDDADKFESLLVELRGSDEWQFIDREYDLRLERVA